MPKVGKTSCTETKNAHWHLTLEKIYFFQKSKFDKCKFAKRCMS